MKPANDIKQVGAGAPFMTDDQGSQTRIVDRLVVEASGNVGRTTHLPPLEYDDPHPPCFAFLFLDDFVKLLLCRIEYKGLEREPDLGRSFNAYEEKYSRLLRRRWECSCSDKRVSTHSISGSSVYQEGRSRSAADSILRWLYPSATC